MQVPERVVVAGNDETFRFQDQQMATLFSQLPVNFWTKHHLAERPLDFPDLETPPLNPWNEEIRGVGRLKSERSGSEHAAHQNGQLVRTESTDSVSDPDSTAEGASDDNDCCRCSSVKTAEKLNRHLQLPEEESRDMPEERCSCIPSRVVLKGYLVHSCALNVDFVGYLPCPPRSLHQHHQARVPESEFDAIKETEKEVYLGQTLQGPECYVETFGINAVSTGEPWEEASSALRTSFFRLSSAAGTQLPIYMTNSPASSLGKISLIDSFILWKQIFIGGLFTDAGGWAGIVWDAAEGPSDNAPGRRHLGPPSSQGGEGSEHVQGVEAPSPAEEITGRWGEMWGPPGV
ncbi:hypothetical protein HPG69_017842 [Diceros bicornis minor]|uniref:Mitochondrial fission factor n=1 Tax=Diceros bicornis minor TaxID=77932 RepID=A0A7J7EIR2_DICBM|nr:hypothetical protein HPG69_017842 [Diceros bicornis minor]